MDLNRRRLHDIEVPESFSAAESFAVDLRNHGEPVHVHLYLDDDLSTAAELVGGGNHYVEGGATTTVRVSVSPPADPVRGRMKVATGYGTESTHVDVELEAAGARTDPVDVDERLARPRGAAEPDGAGSAERAGVAVASSPVDRLQRVLPDRGVVPLAVLVLVAVGISALAAVYVRSAAVLLGVGVVIGGVVAALVFLME